MRRSRNRLATAVVVVVVAVMTTASSGGAIVGGTLDGERHPNVAFVAAYDPDGQALFFCTGTLVSPTVVVTAAHCTGGEPSLGTIGFMRVSFDSAIVAGWKSLVAFDWHPHPGYREPVKSGTSQFLTEQTDDIGVVRLATPVSGISPAPIVAAGVLDRYQKSAQAKKASFTLAGYGDTRDFQVPKKPSFTYDFTRRTTTSGFKSLGSAILTLNGNPVDNANGGGVCSGDSGGPVFDGPAVVAVNSYGMTNCQNQSGHVRLDTASAREFLSAYVPLP